MLEDFLLQFAADNGIDMTAVEHPVQEPVAEKKPRRQHLKYSVEKRRGKVATIITGFVGSDDELQAFAARLKQKLAVGGSARGGEILLQGNVVDKVRQLLDD